MPTRNKRDMRQSPRVKSKRVSKRAFAFQAYVDRQENRETIREGAKKREMSVSQFLVFSALKEASGDHTKHTPADGARETA